MNEARCVTFVVLTLCLTLIGGTARADDTVELCGTYQRFVDKYGAAAENGACAPRGACDLPEVRDAAIPSPLDAVRVVRMHLIVFSNSDGSDPAATPIDVDKQIQQLNQDLAPSRVQVEASVEWVHDSTYRTFEGGPFEEWDMKRTYALEPARRINVFVVRTPGYSFGVFPWDPDALSFLGGIVMHEGHFGPGRSILTHEIGHNLGLWHTHHGVSEVPTCGGCYETPAGGDPDRTGDFAGDTPATPVNWACHDPAGADGCTGLPWGSTDTANYMSYSPDWCYGRFSPHQQGRMQCWIGQRLSTWLVEGPAVPARPRADRYTPVDRSTVFGRAP